MSDKAIDKYLSEQPEDRRVQMEDLRAHINKHMPGGYDEVFNWGMISWEVPLEVYPDTYNKKPLMYFGLANRKHFMTLTMFGIYLDPGLKKKFLADYQKKTGKAADMGAGCLRYKHIDNLPLDLIAWAVAAQPLDQLVATMKTLRRKK